MIFFFFSCFQSSSGSRRNSDLGGLSAVKTPSESRRNSDISYRRCSDISQMRPLNINRRSSEISITTPDKSPINFQTSLVKMDIQERSESDSDNGDCNEKVALMNEKIKDDNTKNRKKSLTWKNIDVCNKNDEDITVASSLLGDRSNTDNRVVVSYTHTHAPIHIFFNYKRKYYFLFAKN